jgi:hypothetical protein
MPRTEKTVRNLLLGIGVGSYQATMVAPNMWQSPAGSDPKSPHVATVVSRLQDRLSDIGYPIDKTGVIDQPTAAALQDVVGDGWMNMPWTANIAAVAARANMGTPAYAQADQMRASSQVTNTVLSDDELSVNLDLSLPSVITYGIGAYLLYRLFSKAA